MRLSFNHVQSPYVFCRLWDTQELTEIFFELSCHKTPKMGQPGGGYMQNPENGNFGNPENGGVRDRTSSVIVGGPFPIADKRSAQKGKCVGWTMWPPRFVLDSLWQPWTSHRQQALSVSKYLLEALHFGSNFPRMCPLCLNVSACGTVTRIVFASTIQFKLY